MAVDLAASGVLRRMVPNSRSLTLRGSPSGGRVACALQRNGRGSQVSGQRLVGGLKGPRRRGLVVMQHESACGFDHLSQVWIA